MARPGLSTRWRVTGPLHPASRAAAAATYRQILAQRTAIGEYATSRCLAIRYGWADVLLDTPAGTIALRSREQIDRLVAERGA